MKHPYDGPSTCVVGLIGLAFSFFGLCLISTLFIPEPEVVPAGMENLENGLATGGIVSLAIGVFLLWDTKNKTFNREEIKDHTQADCLSLQDIALKYWEEHVDRNLSKRVLSKLSDGIYTNGGFVYHLERENGQYYEGIPVYYSVYVDCYGEINAAGYHLALQGITYSDC
jgi:hypothetical protein